MQLSDRKPFLEIVIGFSELRGKTLSAPALELYWNAMQAWSLEDFQAAANRLLLTSEWMPLPHHFEELRNAGRATAGEAWAAALKWAASGNYRAHGLPDPVVNRAVEALGGYKAIAMHDEDKLHFLERRFAEHYATIQDATDTREALPQLAMSPGLAILLQRQVKQLTQQKATA